MKTENKKFYIFFKKELEEILAQGFSREQAFIILKRIHSAIAKVKGYHYAHHCYSAGESLNYLIQQVESEAKELELKEHILDNAYGFRAQASVGDIRRNGRGVYA